MTTKKRLAERRAKNAELARRDRANRCPVCKAPLTQSAVSGVMDLQRFCLSACLEAQSAREHGQDAAS